MSGKPKTLLCVANFSTNTGYAWNFIEGLYSGIATRLARHGIRTVVAYPAICGAPVALSESNAEYVHLDASPNSQASLRKTIAFIMAENVQAIYFSDQPVYSLRYVVLRFAGVKSIIVHDHSSGERQKPSGLQRLAKWILARLPYWSADAVICVSDFVARRHIEVGLIPGARVLRVWNGIEIPKLDSTSSQYVRNLLALEQNRPIVTCACRAVPEKGVEVLFAAFAEIAKTLQSVKPVLVYMGDGPAFNTLRTIRDSLDCSSSIFILGHRQDVSMILQGSDICVVPSLWHEAFGLSVLEGMALAKPVIATCVGGIPEVIEHGKTGLLVPPGDVTALAKSLTELLGDPKRATGLGAEARHRVEQVFSLEKQLDKLTDVIMNGLGR